jgi:carbon storage regulator CsrA
MLVLTRKHQEQIQIGDNVTITILKVKGRTVRLGIEAPRQVRIIRGELPRAAAEVPGSSMVTVETRHGATDPASPGTRSDGRRGADSKDAADSTVVASAGRGNVPRSPLASLVKDMTRVGPMDAVAQ